MPFVGLVSDPRWEPPDGSPDPERRNDRTWRIPWRPVLWTALFIGLLLLVPVVSGAIGPLAGYLLVCFSVGLGVWRIDRWFSTLYWRGLRDYQS